MNAIRFQALWVAAGLSLTAANSLLAGPVGRAQAWGYNASGQGMVPPSLVQVVGIAAGGYHNLVLRSNSTVVAWGNNSNGQINVPAGLSNIVAISAGGYHSLALRNDGTVSAWGDNSVGEISVPVDLTNAIAISAGFSHNLALSSNNTVVAWGYNNHGQTTVPSGLSNIVVAVAAGGYHSLALTSNSTVVAWGFNNSGQTSVPAGLSNVTAIAGGGLHSLALKKDGTLVVWGDNTHNQLNMPAGLSNVVAITAGLYHSLALKADGTVVAWGDNTYGECNVPPDLIQITAISGGGYHSLALTLNMLTVVSQPPGSISLNIGDSTNLSVSILPGPPFIAQWFSNGIPIPGATGTNLIITNFVPGMAGGYAILASNQYAFFTTVTGVRLTNSPAVLLDGVDVGGGPVTRIDSSLVTMSSTLPNGIIYYTLDGSAPDFNGFPYTGPFALTNSATIRTIVYNSSYTSTLEAVPINLQIYPTLPLVITNAGGGTVTLSPPPYSAGNRYLSNTVVTLTATAQATNGWSFLGWSGDISSTNTTITVPVTQPTALNAAFGSSLQFHTNGNGRILLDPPNGPYAYGSILRMTGLPAPGNYFFGWAGGVSSIANPLLYNVTNAGLITALFGIVKSNEVWLMLSPNGDGSVQVSPAQNVYTNGATVTLTATPTTNSVFVYWSGDAAGSVNPLILTLDTNKVIIANFMVGSPTNPPVVIQQPVSLTVSAGSDTAFFVGVTGDSPFTYQWRFGGSAIPGATSSSLELTNITAAQAGLYDVLVTGPGGSTTSVQASLGLFGIQLTPTLYGVAPLLVLQSAPGTSYAFQYASSLAPPAWNLLAPVTLLSNQTNYVDDPISSHPLRFYRALPQ